MISAFDTTHPSKSTQDTYSASPGRGSVYQVFRRHIRVLAGLPGHISEFDQHDFGYEWRCEFVVGYSTATARIERAHPIELHFSLIDLEKRQTPAATLYLVVHGQKRDNQERLLLPLEDLAETHEQLNKALARRDASIEMLNSANHFMTALNDVKELLISDATWA